MNNQVFDKTLYNNELIDLYEYNSIMSLIASGKYSDEVFKGTSIINESIEDFDVTDYTGSLSYTELVKLTQTVTVDQSKKVDKYIRRGDEWVSGYPLVEQAKKKSAKAMAKVSDAFHLAKMTANAGLTLDIEGVTLTKDNVLTELINPIVELFDDNEVDMDDRFLICDSATKNIIEDLDIYTSNKGLDGGRWSGEVKGVKIVTVPSAILPDNANDSNLKDMIALQKDSYQFLHGVASSELGQSENIDGKYFYSVADYGGDVLNSIDKGVIKISKDETA